VFLKDTFVMIEQGDETYHYSFGRKFEMRPCDESIKMTLGLVEEMLELADEGDVVREDSGCGVLYGVLRDSAFKIKKLAESERNAHIQKGWWNE
jgi:hypothetical protein